MPLSSLKEINFCDTSAENIETDIINSYESIANKKLYPGDPVRLFLETLAYIITQQRVIIDFSAKQNLLKYAEDDYLDQVVALVGVKRLDASAAKCTVKFNLSAAQTSVISIPIGTRVKAGEIYFATISYTQFSPGQLEKEVIVECLEKGTIGNGLMPGQVNEIVDMFPYFQSVVNITQSTGGTEVETDDALRERAFYAPSSYSTAGSDEAYAFWAQSVSSDVTDVAVVSDVAGEVDIIPIGKDGELLSNELLNAIYEACTAKNVKPLTDKVNVIQPIIVNYTINFQYYISKNNIAMSVVIQEQVQKVVDEYISWQHKRLGRDINPSELMYRVMQAGAKRVTITSPTFTNISSREIAKVSTIDIVFGGIEDE